MVNQIEADNYIDTDPHGIPVEICKVNKSQFDFKKKRVISTKDIIDHNFCISNYRTKMKKVAQLTHGLLSMELMSTEPGLQVYTGHKIGIALEPQLWPDAPNNELYPSAFFSLPKSLASSGSARLAMSRYPANKSSAEVL